MRKYLLVVILVCSPIAHSMTVPEFNRVMDNELTYPEEMKTYFTGLMTGALFWNAYQRDYSGTRFFCSPIKKVHTVEEHIEMTNYFIETAGDGMREEYKKYGRDFDQIEISQVHAMALLAIYDCDNPIKQ